MIDPVFLDVEASGWPQDGGRPVEIAWSSPAGPLEQYLIRPARGCIYWSKEAERVHGIAPELLAAEGRDARAVAERVVAALVSRIVYTDAPAYDAAWLDPLLALLDKPPLILLRDVSSDM